MLLFRFNVTGEDSLGEKFDINRDIAAESREKAEEKLTDRTKFCLNVKVVLLATF